MADARPVAGAEKHDQPSGSEVNVREQLLKASLNHLQSGRGKGCDRGMEAALKFRLPHSSLNNMTPEHFCRQYGKNLSRGETLKN